MHNVRADVLRWRFSIVPTRCSFRSSILFRTRIVHISLWLCFLHGYFTVRWKSNVIEETIRAKIHSYVTYISIVLPSLTSSLRVSIRSRYQNDVTKSTRNYSFPFRTPKIRNAWHLFRERDVNLQLSLAVSLKGIPRLTTVKRVNFSNTVVYGALCPGYIARWPLLDL